MDLASLAVRNDAKNNVLGGPLGVSDPEEGQQMAIYSPLDVLSMPSTKPRAAYRYYRLYY